MKYSFITIFLFFSLCGHSQTDTLLTRTKEIIQETLTHREINPYHQVMTDSINEAFIQIVENRNTISFVDSFTPQIEMLMRWIYENSRSIYEDSPDYRRMKMRRALCFTTIALLSDHDKAYTFLEYAKLSIVAELNNPDIGLLEEQYLGLLFVEILFKIEEHSLRKNDISLVRQYLSQHHEFIDQETSDKVMKLLKDYEILIR